MKTWDEEITKASLYLLANWAACIEKIVTGEAERKACLFIPHLLLHYSNPNIIDFRTSALKLVSDGP